ELGAEQMGLRRVQVVDAETAPLLAGRCFSRKGRRREEELDLVDALQLLAKSVESEDGEGARGDANLRRTLQLRAQIVAPELRDVVEHLHAADCLLRCGATAHRPDSVSPSGEYEFRQCPPACDALHSTGICGGRVPHATICRRVDQSEQVIAIQGRGSGSMLGADVAVASRTRLRWCLSALEHDGSHGLKDAGAFRSGQWIGGDEEAAASGPRGRLWSVLTPMSGAGTTIAP